MKYFYSLLLTVFCLLSYAQNPIGIPQITTYESVDYKGGSQNWDIDQDKNGILYFANNEGLLTFDGRHWKLYPLPHNTIVRSVKIAEDGKIYVGAQDEIGYFFPDKSGVLKFHSLQDQIPEKDRHFSDIWNIAITSDGVFYRTTDRIFHFKTDGVKVYKPSHLWEYMGENDGKLYAHDSGKGLLVFNNGNWDVLAPQSHFLQDIITSVLDYSKDTLLVSTLKNGLYLMGSNFFLKKQTRYDEVFKRDRIYNLIKVNPHWYAIATYSGGCYIIDKSGNIIQQFSSKEGLYKDNVRRIFLDRNKNLWLGLNEGINLIAFDNAVKYIYPDRDKQISSYATLIHDKTLYIGTTNGVFSNDLSGTGSDLSYAKQNFKVVSNSSGQIWSLRELNGQVLAGTEDGALKVEKNNGKLIYNGIGTWLFEPFAPISGFSTDIIAGTYRGLQLLSFNNSNFSNEGSINGIEEALRFVVFKDNAIWASHPYRGIYRFKLSTDKKRIVKTEIFTEKNGLPSSLGNYITKIKNRIFVASLNGIFEFDANTQKFKKSEWLNSIMKNKVYHYLKEDKFGNIWFISNKKVGVVDFRSKNKSGYTIVDFPELNSQVVAGFENIYPYDNENVFIGATKGLIHINYKQYTQNIKPIRVTLSSVQVSGKSKIDSAIYGGYFVSKGEIEQKQNVDSSIELDKELNSLHFEYSSTLYEQQNNIEFSFQLIGFDKAWSEWSSKSEKDYTNLPHGEYTFKVKARNNLGNESEPVLFSFTITPAWYETVWIFIFYFLCLCGIIYLIIRRQKQKYQKQQEFLKLEHQRQIEHNEKEIVKLRNENLEAEVNFKNKELATTSMHLVQKSKLLSKIKTELMPLVKLDSSKEQPDDLKKVIKLLNEAEKGDEDWEHFSIHFDQVHSNFLAKLKEKVPALSSNDLKLCAYLKMNLTSKEIAQLISITVRAVEVSRYRLRKKLNIPSETNLFDYLIEITS